MAATRRCFICLFLCVTVWVPGYYEVNAATGDDEVIQECVIDSSKPADEPDNYMECNTDENKESGKTDCCTIDGQKACCKQGERWDMIKNLGIGIASATFGLMLIIFLVLWCNPKTFPFLTRWKDSVRDKYRDFEDNMSCCEERVQKKRQDEAQKKRQAELPVYDTPDEITMNVKDEFWGAP